MPFDSAGLTDSSTPASDRSGLLETIERFEQAMRRLDTAADHMAQELAALNASALMKSLRSLQTTAN